MPWQPCTLLEAFLASRGERMTAWEDARHLLSQALRGLEPFDWAADPLREWAEVRIVLEKAIRLGGGIVPPWHRGGHFVAPHEWRPGIRLARLPRRTA